MSSTDMLHEMAAAYSLGALSPEEAKAFEARLASSPDLQKIVREYRDVAVSLAAAVPAVAPPPALRGKVLSRVRAESRGRGPLRLWTALAMAAAVAGILAATVQSVRLAQRSQELREIRTELSAAAGRRDLLQQRLDAVLDDNTQMYAVRPTGQGDPALGFGAQVFWRRDANTWLVHVYNMPRLPEGQVYQLWYVTPDARISAGVLEMDDEGHAIAVLVVPPEARSATLAAVSIEPGPSGSPQPTGAIVIAGSVAER